MQFFISFCFNLSWDIEAKGIYKDEKHHLKRYIVFFVVCKCSESVWGMCPPCPTVSWNGKKDEKSPDKWKILFSSKKCFWKDKKCNTFKKSCQKTSTKQIWKNRGSKTVCKRNRRKIVISQQSEQFQKALWKSLRS